MELKLLADLRFILMDRPSKCSGTSLDPEAAECIRFADWFVPLIISGEYRGIYMHVTNEFAGAKRYVFGAVLKAMGKIGGAPDYVFLWDGGSGVLEFKRPDGKGKPSDKQLALGRICGHSNVNHAFVNTSEEARAKLIEWGALKGNVVEIPSLAPVR